MNRQEYQRQWREKNKDKIKTYQKEYQRVNRETIKKKVSEYGKKWYQKNKERKDAKGKEWSSKSENKKKRVGYVQKYVRNNKEKVKKYGKQYEQTIAGKYRLTKNRHNKRWDSKVITLEEFKKIVVKPCKYCGDENTNKGIDRLKNEIGYTKKNSVSCCSMCNYMKKDYSLEEFLNQVEKIYENSVRYSN